MYRRRPRAGVFNMQIRTKLKTSREESEFDKSLTQELLSAWRELSSLLNGGIKFEDNFNAQIIDVSDSGTINTEFSVSHDLKRVPSGFLVFNINKAGVVYDSGTAWTTAALFLKCSAANATIKLLVF